MAVYTEVSDEELEAFLADYDLGQVLVRGTVHGRFAVLVHRVYVVA